MININSLNGMNPVKGLDNNKSVNKTSGKSSFSEILKNTIEEANELKKESDRLTTDYVAGKTENLHEVMIASQKAEVAISFVVELRNRLMEAYQEFSRMQV